MEFIKGRTLMGSSLVRKLSRFRRAALIGAATAALGAVIFGQAPAYAATSEVSGVVQITTQNGLAVEVQGGGNFGYGFVDTWTNNHTYNQYWDIIPSNLNDGSVWIVSPGTTACITTDGWTGVRLITSYCINSNPYADAWRITQNIFPSGVSGFSITLDGNPAIAMEVLGGNQNPGTWVDIWQNNYTYNQLFTVCTSADAWLCNG